jgi:uncharacterized membrane protein YhaH (DUF805 family)
MFSVLFSFKGRINRAQYWLGCVVLGVALVLSLILAALLTGASFSPSKTDPASMLRAVGGFGLMLFVIMLAFCWSAYAIQTKRFHDRGRSGLWGLAPLAISVPLMLSIVGGALSGKPFEQVAQEAMFWFNILSLINLAMLVDLGLLAGVEGPNKYGDPPGGGIGGYSPSPSPSAPVAPKPSSAQAAASSLLGAQSAMDRAIAERARQAQRPQPAAKPAAAAHAPAPAPRPSNGGAPAFGRRTAH